MKKPLLLASIAGSALFLVAALVIIVGFIHQASQKPNSAADATAQAQHYCKADKHYTGSDYTACYNEYTQVGDLSAQPSSTLLSADASICNSLTGSGITACTNGYTAGYSNLEARLQPAKSSSSAASSPSSGGSKSSSSNSTTSKSSTSSSTKPATTSSTTPPASTTSAPPAASTTTTAGSSSAPPPAAVQSDTPATADQCQNSGGANVSGVWAGIPGVDTIIKNGCIGGNGVNPIYAFVSIIITFATGVLGLVMVLMIVIAGLQYVISNGNPDIVRDAKNRINHVVTGFVIFVLMWGILQVLLPANVSVFK